MRGGFSYSSTRSVWQTINWTLVFCYLALIVSGWLNIYASVQSEEPSSIFDLGSRCGKQFMWMLTGLGIAGLLLFIVPPRVYEPLAPFIYGVVLLLLVAVIFLGSEVKGSHSWFSLGPVKFQPAEISKISTSLMLAAIMSQGGFHLRGRNFWITAATIAIPMLVIVMEKETGTALVYVGFIFVLYREGLSGWFIAILGLIILLFILTLIQSPYVSMLTLMSIITFIDMAFEDKWQWWFVIFAPIIVALCFVPAPYDMIALGVLAAIYLGFSLWRSIRGARQSFRYATITAALVGIILIFSTDFIFDHVLKDYQRARIEVLLGLKEDNSGVGYNVNQSKIAIGSGGWTGKGFCNGTQTAYGFVPEQSTDFIFCTVGEEWGFLGCLAIIGIYVLMITTIIRESERTREAFTRIYGYCLASCIFMHLFINIGMTLGLMPVIGIPLPFMSYGGSSMWTFTTMLFIFIALVKNEKRYF